MMRSATITAVMVAVLLVFSGVPTAAAAGSVGRGVTVRSWYFAEGTTDWGFEEYICIQNPCIEDATVTATYMLPEDSGAGQVVGDPIIVPAFSRTTITVSNQVGASDVSVKIDADEKVICERSMYWNGRIDGHDSIGVTEPHKTWYLAEGCTDYGFEEYICIQNPGSDDATVNMTYNTSSGPVKRDPLVVPGGSRVTVKVNDDLAAPCDVSTRVESDVPVVAERAMYWDSRRGGHSSIGVSSPSSQWFLAEGSTDWGFDTYILLQNPGGNDATVDLKLLGANGFVEANDIRLPAGSRFTFIARDAVGSTDFSTWVESDEDIICERSMYWNNGTGKAGHDTVGVTGATFNCYLAEGCTAYGFETYLLICNPNGEENDVQVTYMTSEGAVPHGGITMAPYSRETILVNEVLPPGDVSMHVAGELPIVAERAMYWRLRGGGHDSIGLMEK